MKNTQIAAAIDALVNAVRALETELEAAKETTTARDDALKGWIAVADERARRLSSLQDDMQGMVSVLNDERAQSTAKIKALETELTEANCALRSEDEVASSLLDQLSAMRTRSLIAEQKLENMDEDLRGAVFARDDLTKQLAEAVVQINEQNDELSVLRAQDKLMPYHIPLGTEVFYRNGERRAVSKHTVDSVRVTTRVGSPASVLYTVSGLAILIDANHLHFTAEEAFAK